MLILQSLLSFLAIILFQFSDEWKIRKIKKLSKLSKKVLVSHTHAICCYICNINTRMEHHHHRREMGAQLNWKWKRAAVAGGGDGGAKYPS